jgi:glutathione S-transferase
MALLTLVIGNKNYSSWSLRPWLLLRHAGIPFEERRVALSLPTTRSALAPLRSNFKVPVLLDGELAIWDSLAILEYVSEHHLGGEGWPADRALRALGRSVSAEMHSSFANLRAAMPMNCRKHFPEFPVTAPVRRDIERIVALWELCAARREGPGDWLLGRFSIADAMYAPVALRFHSYDVELTGAAAAFVSAVLAHPAIVEWMAAARQEIEVIAEDEVAL